MARIIRLIFPVCFLVFLFSCSEDDPVGPVGTPSQRAPEAGAQLLPGRVQFSWEAASGAASYRLQVGFVTESGFMPEHDTSLSGTSCNIYIDLDRIGKNMGWRLQPIGEEGRDGAWSDVSPFTAKAFMQHPAHRVTVRPGRVTLSWEPLPGATAYEVQVGRANGHIFFKELDTTVVATDCALYLNGGWKEREVAWRIRPVCPGSGMNAWSVAARFSVDGWNAVHFRMENAALQYRALRGRGDPLLRYPRYDDVTFSDPVVEGNRWTYAAELPVSLEHLLDGLNGKDRISLVLEFDDELRVITEARLVLTGSGSAPVGGIGGTGRYFRDLALQLRDIPLDVNTMCSFVLRGDDVATHTEALSDSILVYAGYWQIDPLGQGGGQTWISLADELFVLDALQASEATRIRFAFE